MKKYFESILIRLESHAVPFYNYILLFISAVTLRNFLEIFSDKAKVPFIMFSCNQSLYYGQWVSLFFSFLHYYMVWVVLALGLGLILYKTTRKSLSSIFRVIFALFFIINLTPLVDLLTSSGLGKDLTYLRPRYITDIFPWPKGMTTGMVTTTIAGLIAVYFYSILKGVKKVKALAASAALYLLLLFLALMPFLFHLKHPLAIARVLWIMFLAECIVIAFIARPKLTRALLSDLRLARLIYFTLLFFMGILLVRGQFASLFTARLDVFLLALIVIAGCWYVGVIFNNIEDRDIDEVSNPNRPLTTSLVSLSGYRYFGFGVIFVTLWSAIMVNFQTALFAMVLMGNTFFYSLPPLRGKRIPVLSKLFASFNCLIIVMLGFIFAGGNLRAFPAGVSWFFLVFITLAYNFIDLKDYEGDKKAGVYTLPVLIGPRMAASVIGIFCLSAYVALGLVFINIWLAIFGLILGCVQFCVLNRKPYKDSLAMVLHVTVVLILVITLIVFGSPIQQNPSVLLSR